MFPKGTKSANEVITLKLTIEGTTGEIQKVLQDIAGSEEYEEGKKLYENVIKNSLLND